MEAGHEEGTATRQNWQQVAITVIYCAVMAVNGGTVGAFGPSLEAFERNTKLPQAAIGSAVLIHRLTKLLGTIVWGWYASLLQRRREQGVRMWLSPHVFMSVALLLTGVSSTLLGVTKNARVFQGAMGMAGFCYGISDSACNLLVLWAWQHDSRRQRSYVALLNAMFTSGAFITPMFVAASLHWMQGVVWPAFHTLAVVGAVQALALPLLPPPRAPYRGPVDVDDDEERHELEALKPTPSQPLSAASPPLVPAKPFAPTTPAAEAGAKADGAEPGPLSLETPPGSTPDKPQPGFRVQLTIMVAVCVLCMAANGCEHAVATWLSPYGVDKLGLDEERMAIMTSNFWTTMSFGRLLWAAFSGVIESAWPVIFATSAMCLLSGFCLLSKSEPVLWFGALLIGAGVSSSFPSAVTLPPEMGVQMSPRMMTILCLCASFGEMAFPFIVALFFQQDMYSWFGGLVLVSQTAAIAILTTSWLLLTGRLRVEGFSA